MKTMSISLFLLTKFPSLSTSKIHEQVGKYLPYIEIQDLFIDSSDTNLAIEGNYIHIKIFYKIVPLSSFDVLDIEFVDT